jgi:hypothetical protein
LRLIGGSVGVNDNALSEVTDRFQKSNDDAENIFHQIVNGLYRSVDLLRLILEKVGADESEIREIRSKFMESDENSKNVNHQMLNGTSRIFECFILLSKHSVPILPF